MSEELDIDSSSHWGDASSNTESRLDSNDDNIPPSAPLNDTPAARPSHRLNPRVSTLRSRARKSAPVKVEEVQSSDPLGPLGLPTADDSASSNDTKDTKPFYQADKESEEISKAIQHYNSNNERLALFGNEELTSNPFAADRLVEPVEGLSVKDSEDVLPTPTTPLAESSGLPEATTSTRKRKDTLPAKETFDISVGDPIKVGDLTSAHTVYTVHTKTSSPNFSKKEAAVTRRYRDFRWVYHALENNNPGIIIPPPPEKQAVGRFNEDFVEARRSALENMLIKIAKHPVLQNDPDFRIFLESDTFSTDIKSKQYHETTAPVAPESKGFMSSLGGAFSFQGKFVETDEWFVEKKTYVDTLESQFKYLTKALDAVLTQRKDLSDATAEFSSVLSTLSTVELSKTFCELIERFAETELRIRDLYFRQCMQDVLSLATTLDEYIRLLSSIRVTFSQRQKAYFALQAAEQTQSKKKTNLAKVLKSGKTLTDKVAALTDDLAEQDKRVLNARVAFDDISKQIVNEFDRFEAERADDLRDAVELYLENAVEAQKEAIEVWETFYQLSGFVSVTDSPTTAAAADISSTQPSELTAI